MITHRKFPYIKVFPTDGNEAAVMFPGNGLIPEWATQETIYYMNGTAVQEYLTKRVIYENYAYDEVLIVRNDLARPFWWVVYRIVETLALLKYSSIRLLMIWGLANIELGSYPRWCDIRPLGWIYKRLKRANSSR